jgi:hypothetical protein
LTARTASGDAGAPSGTLEKTGGTNMPLPPAETLVLQVLRSHADFLTWHEGKNGVWAKVIPNDARAELSVRTIEDVRFTNILKLLASSHFYKEIGSEAWVNMGKLPQQDST